MKTGVSALDEIRADHDLLRELFDQWDAEPPGSPREAELVERCLHELEIHGQIETEIFYPECRSVWTGDTEIFDDYVDDHLKINALAREIRLMPAAARAENFQRLRDDALDHLDEEEENLLPEVEDLISSEEMIDIGERIRSRREALRTGNGASTRVA